MDRDLFIQALELLANASVPEVCVDDPELYAGWLLGIMESSCDLSTPRVAKRNTRRRVYWWSEEISGLRALAVGARRRLTRARARSDRGIVLIRQREYKRARRSLRVAIGRAKRRSWNELIDTIRRDPWGLPYRLVMEKLRPFGPALSGTLGTTELNNLLDTLFPSGRDRGRVNSRGSQPVHEWEEGDTDVGLAEMREFVKKRPTKNTAPGPDNVKSTIWKRVPDIVLAHLANVMTLCLRKGRFPAVWKRAILVLIPKGQITAASVTKARPICLLDELGKTLERVIALRVNRWMEGNPDCALSSNQYGFRRQRFTVDALMRVRELTRDAVGSGGYAIAVGLDVSNAFNSMPWGRILDALVRKRVPAYLRDIIADYLSCRSIVFRDSSGCMRTRAVRAGVPQGSVLGPLLWNIAFDSVLGFVSEEGCHTVCYADDTLLISTSDRLFEAIVKINVQIARVTRHITSLGLTVAEEKTEAVLFCRRLPRVMPVVRVGRARVPVGSNMKYLGVVVDSAWNFREHLRYIEVKVARVTRALSRLMPNIRDPGERKRRLYSGVVTSIVMYAAPVWGGVASVSPAKVLRPLRRLQRTVAIRVVSAYRTVSFDAATLLAGMPPWVLEVTLRRRIYLRLDELKRRGDLSQEASMEIRAAEGLLLMRQWEVILGRRDDFGLVTIRAIRPHLVRWMGRKWGEINYFSTQMLSGHGSFGHFLSRIGRRESTSCIYCPEVDDDVGHTFFVCPAWQP